MQPKHSTKRNYCLAMFVAISIVSIPLNNVTAAKAVPQGLEVQVFPSPAPNAFGSPSFSGWGANAINGLENGISNIGNPSTTPTAYYQTSTLNDRDNIVFSFPSWKGFANPGTVFGPAFASELGNRLHFGLHILGGGVKIRLSNLDFHMHGTDPGDIFAFDGSFTGSDTYSPIRVGVDYGPDGVKGTGDDVRITSGAGTQVVDEIIYVGVGNAIAPGDVGCFSGTDQNKLDCVKLFYDSIIPFSVTTLYSIFDDARGEVLASGDATVNFVPTVPNNPWTSASSTVTVDEDSQAKISLNNFVASLKNGQTGTVTLRSNITATHSISAFCPATQAIIRVRYRDGDGNGTDEQVVFTIHQSSVLSGGNNIIFTFDSNTEFLTPDILFHTVVKNPAIDFDFSQNIYWINAEITRNDLAGLADLGSIDIWESAGTPCGAGSPPPPAPARAKKN